MASLAWLHPFIPHCIQSCAGGAEEAAASGSIPRTSLILQAQQGRFITAADEELKSALEKWELQNISPVPPQKSKNELEKGKVREKAEL